MEILRNESVKEILRGPAGQNGLPGLTVRVSLFGKLSAENK